MVPVVVLIVAAGLCRGQATRASSKQRDAAIALQQEGQTIQAEAAWQAVLASHPDDAEAWANIGVLESQQQHFSQAVRDYRRALVLNPSMPGLRMNLGLALFKAGDMKDAAQVFTLLYRRASPDSPEAQRLRILIGMADYGAGSWAGAVVWLRGAMARDPQDLPYRLVLAHACLWSKQYQCVLDVYHQILSLNAESAEADMLAGEAYDEMRDHEDAIQQFRNAVKADPRVPGVHFGLGYLLWCQSQFQDAAQQFQLEVANTPHDAQSVAYWADSEVRLNQMETARPLVEGALKLNPKQELPWLDLGIIDAVEGHNEDALRNLDTAARLAPSDVQVHWRLARLYQAMGRRAEAHAEFAKTKVLTKVQDETVFHKLQSRRSGDAGGGSSAAQAGSSSTQR